MGLLYRLVLPNPVGPHLILRLCLIVLTGLALVQPVCADEPAEALQGTVTWVHDGDTIEIEKLGKVRLIGIDTPEREDSPRDAFLQRQGVSATRQREIYHKAKAFNISYVKKQTVSLTFDHPPRDRYGRLLAYVYLPDGRLLNRILLEQGLAVVYRKFTFRMKTDFLAAEEQARQAGLGLWKKERL
jgi:micrococcal nuclease